MKKRIFITLGIVVILAISLSVFLMAKKIFTPKETHYHAAFVVFENGKKKDFSSFEYMYVKPCKLDEKNDDKNTDTQLKKAHLHDNVGDVIHVEQEGAYWKDIFVNIKYSLKNKNFVGYINGKRVQNFQNQPIHEYDILSVFVGDGQSSLAPLDETPTKAYIQKVEKKSKNCSD